MTESLMKTLEQEEVDASAYRNLEQARAAIGEFIESVYNRQRLHSALDHLSPVELEADLPIARGAGQHPLLSAPTSCP